ncbi:hypothetical protein NM688_g2407 [Phlebia brevispora]|uniref:Uncharacterized protein n=1 Tax=Phlebia brevispora TaxID=194682 RepID=A0ACC1T8P5_9APHY|nr:hypothetical protein NM688_g2407 [Phlebia brevispora]
MPPQLSQQMRSWTQLVFILRLPVLRVAGIDPEIRCAILKPCHKPSIPPPVQEHSSIYGIVGKQDLKDCWPKSIISGLTLPIPQILLTQAYTGTGEGYLLHGKLEKLALPKTTLHSSPPLLPRSSPIAISITLVLILWVNDTIAMEEDSYDVVPEGNASLRLSLILLDGRDPRVPPVFKFNGAHPLWKHSSINMACNVYIFFVDPRQEAKDKWIALQERIKIPYCRDEELNRVCPGLIELQPGDCVFARVYNSSGDPVDDILQGFVPPLGTAQNELQDLILAAEGILGTEEQRATANKIAFEGFPRVKQVSDQNRAYLIGESIERPRQADAPAAASKIYEGKLEPEQKLQKEFVRAAAAYKIRCWDEHAPEDIRHVLSKYSDAINAPRAGVGENYMWPSYQLNVAPAQHGDSVGSLEGSLEFFGAAHNDKGDCETSYSEMTVVSDLPSDEGWQGGRFNLLALGSYIRLVRWCTVFFSGRLRHGGTAPLAPVGLPAPEHAFRVVLISYPLETVIQGHARHALAALPYSSDPLWLSPEMYNIVSQLPTNVISSTHANFAGDGYMLTCHGELVAPSPWAYGPSGDIHGTQGHQDPVTPHDAIRAEFTGRYWQKMAQAIPYIPNEYPVLHASKGHQLNIKRKRSNSCGDEPESRSRAKRYNRVQLKERDDTTHQIAELRCVPQNGEWSKHYEAKLTDTRIEQNTANQDTCFPSPHLEQSQKCANEYNVAIRILKILFALLNSLGDGQLHIQPDSDTLAVPSSNSRRTPLFLGQDDIDVDQEEDNISESSDNTHTSSVSAGVATFSEDSPSEIGATTKSRCTAAQAFIKWINADHISAEINKVSAVCMSIADKGPGILMEAWAQLDSIDYCIAPSADNT